MKTITSIISQPQEEYQFPQPLNQILFFDIETTGLSPKASSLYLIGAMYYDTEHSTGHCTSGLPTSMEASRK
mgnify:CR=1 FL=1